MSTRSIFSLVKDARHFPHESIAAALDEYFAQSDESLKNVVVTVYEHQRDSEVLHVRKINAVEWLTKNDPQLLAILKGQRGDG